MKFAKNHQFTLDFSVRDYECDSQGIVNNAVYQNYLEHTRHEYLKTLGIDFAEYTRKNLFLIVVRIEIDYKKPLRSGNRFSVNLSCFKASPLKVLFEQEIHSKDPESLCLKAKVFATCVNEKGKFKLPSVFEDFTIRKPKH